MFSKVKTVEHHEWKRKQKAKVSEIDHNQTEMLQHDT
jgi:hypothetical protein